MGRDTKVKVSIEATGEARVKAAMRGITTEAEKASTKTLRATERTAKTAEAVEARSASVRKGIHKAIATDAEQDEQRRRKATRGAETQARAQQRAEQRRRGTFGGRVARFGGAVAAGAMAGGMAAAGRVQSYQAAAGVRTREELVRAAVEFRQNFIRVAQMAGLTSEERAAALQKIGG